MYRLQSSVVTKIRIIQPPCFLNGDSTDGGNGKTEFPNARTIIESKWRSVVCLKIAKQRLQRLGENVINSVEEVEWSEKVQRVFLNKTIPNLTRLRIRYWPVRKGFTSYVSALFWGFLTRLIQGMFWLQEVHVLFWLSICSKWWTIVEGRRKSPNMR